MSAIIKTELHIDGVTQSSVTGHVEINAYVVDTDADGTETFGVPETHGIDPLALVRRFGDGDGNMDRWIATVKATMLSRHGIRKGIKTGLHAMVGKRV